MVTTISRVSPSDYHRCWRVSTRIYVHSGKFCKVSAQLSLTLTYAIHNIYIVLHSEIKVLETECGSLVLRPSIISIWDLFCVSKQDLISEQLSSKNGQINSFRPTYPNIFKNWYGNHARKSMAPTRSIEMLTIFQYFFLNFHS